MSKKDSYWFRHDSTAGRALKMRKMAHIYGHWGKGVYWDVCEILRDNENYSFESDESSLQMLADLIGCKDENKFISWYRDCIKYGLLDEVDGMFFSPALSNGMVRWEASKNNGSKGGRPKKETENKPKQKPKENLNNNLNETITEQNRTKEDNNIDWDSLKSIFNKIANKQIRVINTKTKNAIKARLKEGYSKDDIVKAIQNCYNDSYHRETNHKYLTLEFISRPDKLDKFSNIETPKPYNPNLTPEEAEKNLLAILKTSKGNIL
jgi:uncharacterized phage protein (TIGR02220 family)